jgi:Ca-activated chloride channel family protein
MKNAGSMAIIGIFLLIFSALAGGKYISAFPTIPKPKERDVNSKTDSVTDTVTWDIKLSHPYVEKGSLRDMFLNLRIKGKEAELKERTPVNLVLVIDRSGSMGDRGKIEYAREAAKQIIAGLNKEDRLAVVAYSTDVELLFPIQLLTDKDSATSVVNALYPTESTNLSGGLARGIEQLDAVKRDGYVNRVILLSDGLANAGITDIGELGRIASRASERGIHITTMGLGVDYDENLMMSLAEHGAGNYYFIESPTQLTGIFRKEFGQIAATVAKDPVIRIGLAPGVTLEEVYGYTWTKTPDGVTEVKLGDFFGGQERDILVKLKVPAGKEGQNDLGKAALEFKDLLDNEKPSGLVTQLSYEVTDDADKVAANENKDVSARWISVDASGAYYQATTAYESGDKQGALSKLKQAYDSIANLNMSPYRSARTVEQEAELRDAIESISDPAAPAPMSDEGKKIIKQQKANAREAQK